MPRKRGKATGPRASWRGQFRVDLVTFPVQAFNVEKSGGGEYHFHQLHAPCHNRIHYEKVCPEHGPVPNDEIVAGYEYGKGRYIEIDPEELDKLRTKADRALSIDTFIAPEEIDPIYYDGRSYFLFPDGHFAEEPYAVLLAAMRKMNRCGVGQVVFSEKEQLVLVRPGDDCLRMFMLHHYGEVRTPEALKFNPPKAAANKVKLAESLIDAATEPFELSDYTDRYQTRLKQLIDAKLAGHEVVAPEEEEEPEVINLMDALRRSIALAESGKPSHARGARKTKKSKTTAKKAGAAHKRSKPAATRRKRAS
jgi:DNA end-binding protein Ku